MAGPEPCANLQFWASGRSALTDRTVVTRRAPVARIKPAEGWDWETGIGWQCVEARGTRAARGPVRGTVANGRGSRWQEVYDSYEQLWSYETKSKNEARSSDQSPLSRKTYT